MVYLGPWEYHRRTGTTAYVKTILHVEAKSRVAQAERVLTGADPNTLGVFHVHPDHLSSAQALTKSDGTFLCQEEFFAYGRSSDRRDSRNRYRFIGVERDEEMGLCMTGPRTYDPIVGRFHQPDSKLTPHVSPFNYAFGSPISLVDDSGKEPTFGGLLGGCQPEQPMPDAQAGLQVASDLSALDATYGTDTSVIRARYDEVGVSVTTRGGGEKGNTVTDFWDLQRGPIRLTEEVGFDPAVEVHEGVHSLVAKEGTEFREIARNLANDEYRRSMPHASEALGYYTEQMAGALQRYESSVDRLVRNLEANPDAAESIADSLETMRSDYENERSTLKRAVLDGVQFEKNKPITNPAFLDTARMALGHSLEFDDIPAVGVLNEHLQYQALGMPW